MSNNIKGIKIIERIFKMAILVSIGMGIKLGGYEEGSAPQLLQTPWSEEAIGLGMKKIKDILGGEYNPLTSPYYKGLKEEAAGFKSEGISDIRQRSQLGGMLYSEPAMGIESEFTGQIGTGLTKELGRLYESDINRQAGMIPQLLSFADLGNWYQPEKIYKPGLLDYILPLSAAWLGKK